MRDNYRDDLEAWGGPTPAPVAKGEYVLGLLTAAGLRTPFGMDLDEAAQLWAELLAPFTLETLERAVGMWASDDTHDFPAIGELVTLATYVTNEPQREAAQRERARQAQGQSAALDMQRAEALAMRDNPAANVGFRYYLWCKQKNNWPVTAAQQALLDAHPLTDEELAQQQSGAELSTAPAGTCPECGDPEADSGGRVYLTDVSQGGIGTSRPCSACRPQQYAPWRAGCFAPGHYGCRTCRPSEARYSNA